MDIDRILHFLTEVAANNNRPWFQAHRDEYQQAHASFEADVRQLIVRLSEFDPEVANLTAKDCIYRFYRDTRFSPDKSPYKRHFGAYICARGKKALRGGYYVHVEPGNCLLAAGSYWLPTNILTSCRNEMMGNMDEWRRIVEDQEFVDLFGRPGEGVWEKTEKGFGLESLKTCPKGFPRDYEFVDYLRMKDYCCWRRVDDQFFAGDDWFGHALRVFRVAKPMMDFMNGVIDDYE